jgi:hypothetical protein
MFILKQPWNFTTEKMTITVLALGGKLSDTLVNKFKKK